MTDLAELAALDKASQPVYMLDWEDGVRIVTDYPCRDRTDAFRVLDRMMSGADYPSSLHIILRADGVAFWAQHGTHVELNR